MRIIRITKKNNKPVVERSIDCEIGVDKIRPLRTKAKQQNKAAKEQNIQK